jgi:hypothetical protein
MQDDTSPNLTNLKMPKKIRKIISTAHTLRINLLLVFVHRPVRNHTQVTSTTISKMTYKMTARRHFQLARCTLKFDQGYFHTNTK